ncbi:MAG TPA: SGNH/GDSL hydrolase family protein [Isosphaeraceae bacterium]|jgi:hypothetical protein|nr:SGNH/GDSL hydrolase family protein [Isosphaeraceae bacterium]
MRLSVTTRPKPPPARQRLLPFGERAERLDRRFRRGIAAATALALVALVAGTATGRDLVLKLVVRAKWAVQGVVGLEPDRTDIDAEWARRRARDIAHTKDDFRVAVAEEASGVGRFLKVSGMDPDSALIRWANYDHTLVLSSRVFEADERRSYRLRPHVRSFWVQNLPIGRGVATIALVPDEPAVRAAVGGSGGRLVSGSEQTTNSWGLRGPEPDRGAAVHGIVVGDSFMQGVLVGDADTPPARLERRLAEAWGVPVSVLNAGLLGYSPEQYYWTLIEYADRFKPQFVVLSLFANDFGSLGDALDHGKGDWDEGRFWLNEAEQFCRSRGILLIITPVPCEVQIGARRRLGNYPGQVSNICQAGGLDWCDPIEDFVDEHLRLVREGERHGRRPYHCPLFLGRIGDGHFSPEGAETWARALATRIALRLKPPADTTVGASP